MQRIFIVAACLLALASCGKIKQKNDHVRGVNVQDFPNISNSIYGAWMNVSNDTKDGITYQSSAYFNIRNEAGFVTECTKYPDSVSAGTTVDATIGTTSYTISDSYRMDESSDQGIVDCPVLVTAGEYSYTVNGDTLSVSSPGKPPQIYNRIK